MTLLQTDTWQCLASCPGPLTAWPTHQSNLPSPSSAGVTFLPSSLNTSKVFQSILLFVLFPLSGMLGESHIICGKGPLKYCLFFIFIFISNHLLHENISSPAIFWISMAFFYIIHNITTYYSVCSTCLFFAPTSLHHTHREL